MQYARFEHRGSAALKGLPDGWQLYAVEQPVGVR